MSIINSPSDWIMINETDYPSLGIINDNDLKCLSAYAVNNEGLLSLVCFYDFSDYGIEYLNDLDKSLVDINKTNELIDGEESSNSHEETYAMKNIFHGYSNDYNKVVYININKVFVQEDQYGYTIQTFVEQKKGLLCAQCSVHKLDESDPLKSAFEIKFIKDAISCIL